MSINNFNRRALTNAVIAKAAEPGKPVGDHEAPDAGGWQGEQSTSNFVAYSTVYAGSGAPQRGSQGGGLRGAQSIIRFPYSVVSTGRTRDSAEEQGFKVREALLELLNDEQIVGWKIINVEISQYGAVTRTPSEPPLHEVTDTVSFTVTPN